MESDSQVWISTKVRCSPWCWLGRQKQIGWCLGTRSAALIYHLAALILGKFCRDDGNIYSPPRLFCEKDKEFASFKRPEIRTWRKAFAKALEWTAIGGLHPEQAHFALLCFGENNQFTFRRVYRTQNCAPQHMASIIACAPPPLFQTMPEMALLKIATCWKLSRYPLRVEEMDK